MEGEQPMQKVIVTLPPELLEEVDKLAAKIEENRSEFVREALQVRIDLLRKEELEAQMIEGYTWMAKEDERDAKAYLSAAKKLKE
jgi:metal-responsive CopG/Arc/MetJ family transcriptional regulator